MFQALRKHITPATVLAFVALVFAITGGAFAATGSGGGAGAKASASVTPPAVAAKAKAKPKTKAGPRGPAGPKGATGATGPGGAAGPAGPAGAAGAKGENGAAGGPGTAGAPGGPGANGKSVAVAEEKAGGANCKGQGGASLEQEGSGKKVYACNGQTGFTETLPQGRTETGTWLANLHASGEAYDVPISFNIPLAAGIESTSSDQHVFDVTQAEWEEEEVEIPAGSGTIVKEKDPAACEGGTPEDPKADEGDLCVYEGFIHNASIAPVFKPSGLDQGGTGTAGALLPVTATAGAPIFAYGSWAVTAE